MKNEFKTSKTWGQTPNENNDQGSLIADGKFVKGKPFSGTFLIKDRIEEYKEGKKINEEIFSLKSHPHIGQTIENQNKTK